MTEEKQQKFTAKVRRGLVWVHSVASAELAKKKAEATGVRIEGFTASELADVESALTWIAQNKESPSTDRRLIAGARLSILPAYRQARSGAACAVAIPRETGSWRAEHRRDCDTLIPWPANAH